MESIKLAWNLWRLSRRLLQDSAGVQGASFTIVIEGPASLREARNAAAAAGLPEPDPRVGCEVCYWPNVGDQGHVFRGHNFSEALKRALKGTE